MKKIIYLLLSLLIANPVFGDEIDDAIELINSGKYREAKELLHIIEKEDPLATLYLGRIAFLEYDYPEATRIYANLTPEIKSTNLYPVYMRELQTGKQMLKHVEQIMIVDSIAVDRENFFKNYRLSSGAGRLLDNSELKKLQPQSGKAETAFINEFEDYMLWSHPDSDNIMRIYESSLLTDGTWSAPRPLAAEINTGIKESSTPISDNEEDSEEEMSEPSYDAAYPFMLDDGLTLYFASDNESSLGGYDIYLATKDADTGEYLQPRNLGMPFNSPSDDYMMAIDQLTGVGWWASERNDLEDKITIYVFALPENRINVDSEDENLIERASLRNFRLTRNDDDEAIIVQLMQNINNIQNIERKQRDFTLPMPGGKTYTLYSDFMSKEAAAKMREYIENFEKFQNEKCQLKELRQSYHNEGNSSKYVIQIQKMEKQLRNEEEKLNSQLSEIYKLEKKK